MNLEPVDLNVESVIDPEADDPLHLDAFQRVHHLAVDHEANPRTARVDFKGVGGPAAPWSGRIFQPAGRL